MELSVGGATNHSHPARVKVSPRVVQVQSPELRNTSAEVRPGMDAPRRGWALKIQKPFRDVPGFVHCLVTFTSPFQRPRPPSRHSQVFRDSYFL